MVGRLPSMLAGWAGRDESKRNLRQMANMFNSHPPRPTHRAVNQASRLGSSVTWESRVRAQQRRINNTTGIEPNS